MRAGFGSLPFPGAVPSALVYSWWFVSFRFVDSLYVTIGKTCPKSRYLKLPFQSSHWGPKRSRLTQLKSQRGADEDGKISLPINISSAIDGIRVCFNARFE